MKQVFVGIDLSFKSTGITIYNQYLNEIVFFRVVSGKPKSLSKVNTIRYDIPYNFKFINAITDDFTLSEKNKSLKAIMCIKTIISRIQLYINSLKDKPDIVIFGLEAHLMPVINGVNQFQGLSGLIGLNYILREHIVMFGYKNNLSIDLCILSPSEIKKVFTDNGKADKVMMFDVFMNKFDGNKLFGSINVIQHLNDYNDLIDSFAICYLAIYRSIYNPNKERKAKKRSKNMKTNKKQDNIWELSL